MKKTSESLTAQLRDVARAFCLEVWGHTLDAAGASTKSELRAQDKVYYPPALRLAPIPLKSPGDPSSVLPSSINPLAQSPSSTSAKGKEKGKTCHQQMTW